VFFIPLIPDSVEAEQSEIQYQERLKDCTGSYKERYDCKQDLKSERDTERFVPIITGIGIVFTPILILFFAMNFWAKSQERQRQAELRETTIEKRQEIREEEEKRREENRKIQQEQVRKRNIESKRRSDISRADENARAENKSDPIHALLILSDDEERSAIEESLNEQDCHVVATNTVEDGLIGIEKLRYDVVIIGILIEGLGGIEGIKKIREHRNDIKIIAASAGTGDVNAEEVLKAAESIGADATITRPINIKALRRLILKLVDKSS
ncbi:MAG: response regulator, partial [Rhodospirillales bacterium]